MSYGLGNLRRFFAFAPSSKHTLENGYGSLQGTDHKEHATLAGIIKIVKFGPGNKEQISVNTPL